ncbi:tRNA preQ1(34) S-adenosylmethionine ribosyltransferase-isomerase QueA [Kamptonema formosum]|uniref:tRNA preQ1(34) S-adenosylmethionine ribosyltransferase-isomerase QueA n=1 Tax=Kamptonema formosum TaxID=331992 RepID=UPI0005C616D4
MHPLSPTPAQSGPDWDLSNAAYDYFLPAGRIAQNPAVPRDSSRLLVVDSPTHHSHRIFRDLPDLLQPNDLLVLNNTRVIPARLYGHKSTGTPVEVLLLEPRTSSTWLALVKPGKRLKPGALIEFEQLPPCHRQGSAEHSLLRAKVLDTDEGTGGRILEFDVPEGVSFAQLIEEFGHVPLPPYITESAASPNQYQTVYADHPGAVAAPTAGLHFTEELLQRLAHRGIDRAFVTLHVGVGTFRPVEVEDLTTHKMHEEWVEVPVATVGQIRQTRERGGRVIAVGTTVVRALEGAAASGQLQPFCGKTDLFIYPGYEWRVVEGLITNFHLPRSSLLMLVSALVGRKRLLDLYQEAIAQEYRFYSFGDAMLILPDARG